MEKVLVILCILCIGCKTQDKITANTLQEKSQVAVSTPTPIPLTDRQKIDILRTEAHKRGLRWSVTCMDREDNPSEQFFAMAEDKSQPRGAVYMEDGALPWWAEYGATQADAAYNLYLSIQQPPGMHPSHRDKEKTHKYCPPQLRGE